MYSITGGIGSLAWDDSLCVPFHLCFGGLKENYMGQNDFFDLSQCFVYK